MQEQGRLSAQDRQQLKKYVKLCARLEVDTLLVATQSEEWDESANDFLAELQRDARLTGTTLESISTTQLRWPPESQTNVAV